MKKIQLPQTHVKEQQSTQKGFQRFKRNPVGKIKKKASDSRQKSKKQIKEGNFKKIK